MMYKTAVEFKRMNKSKGALHKLEHIKLALLAIAIESAGRVIDPPEKIADVHDTRFIFSFQREERAVFFYEQLKQTMSELLGRNGMTLEIEAYPRNRLIVVNRPVLKRKR